MERRIPPITSMGLSSVSAVMSVTIWWDLKLGRVRQMENGLEHSLHAQVNELTLFIFIFCKSLWIRSFVSRVWPGGPGVLVTTLSHCEPFFVTSSKTQRVGRHENLVNTWCDPPLKNPGYAPVFPFASWVNPFPIAAFKKHWFKIERVYISKKNKYLFYLQSLAAVILARRPMASGTETHLPIRAL